MVFRTPSYYNKFKCLADKCSDNCCIGWEIDVDNITLEKYMSIDGDFGKRLKQNISDGSFVLNEKERCPFLNSRNLCDIYAKLGEDSLCQICTNHPRFYEWFGNIKEGGIGLCCEAAARLIISENFSLTEEIISEDESEYPDELLFDFLNDARQVIIDHLHTDSDFKDSIGCLLCFAEELQFRIDNKDYTIPEWKNTMVPRYPDIKSILHIFTELEPMDENWILSIHNSMKFADSFKGYKNQHEIYLRRIAVYFIYRYFLKGAFDGEVLSKVKLAVLSTWVIAYLGECKPDTNFENIVITAKNYSKEIEYCTENLETLYEAFYTESCLASDFLLGFFF